MNSEMNVSMYEIALRKKIRFNSPRGLLSLENLWDVPLRSRDDFNLDVVARTASKELNAVSEGSFVEPDHNDPRRVELELKLDIVRHVIGAKKDEEAQDRKRAENKKERERLYGILAQKEDEELQGLSKKDIEKRIQKLGDD